jgi:Family of unknown function (DUF6498)
MTGTRGVLPILAGGVLAGTMLSLVFVSVNPVAPGRQSLVFAACLAGLGAFFYGLFTLIRDDLERAGTPEGWMSLSTLVLLAGNLVPAAGVLFWGWEAIVILMLFWLEIAIAGAYAAIADGLARRSLATALKTAATFAAVFAFYGVFVLMIYFRQGDDHEHIGTLVRGGFADLGLFWPLVALAVSHGAAFLDDARHPRVALEDSGPYKRVFTRLLALHVSVCGGGLLSEILGSPAPALLLLVAVKTAIELYVHRQETLEPAKEAPPVVAASLAPAADSNDRPLAHYIGTWTLAAGQPQAPGWFKAAEFYEEAGRLRLRLADHAGPGDAPDALESVDLRGSAERIEWIEVRLKSGGTQRILRFTASGTDPDGLDLNELQHPEGNVKSMQARSFTLKRRRSG